MTRSLTGKRIGLLTASASRLGGGVFEAVVAQAGIIDACGGEPVVFALDDAHTAEDRARFGAAQVKTFAVRGPRQIGYAPELLRGMLAEQLDCLHLHGIWMYPSRAGAQWARATGRGYVVSPHGMLDPWITARGRWKKALARTGYERASWQVASFMHALTQREASDIADESGRQDSMVIANAAPPVSKPDPAPRAPHVIYIGRIHSKKNLLALVAAWNEANLPPGSCLTIAGWGDPADVAALQAAVATTSGAVQFIGPIFGLAKAAMLVEARYMALPSLSEGLPMAVLEGWAAGTPTIMTSECNLPDGFAAGAAIECGDSTAEIANALELALNRSEADWLTMSRNALALAAGPFSSETIAARWGEAYALAIAEGSRRA
ncbi:MAG: glycosyltransferase [Novosphingobium sp.]